ncbi:MAG: sodium transport system permease protein [Kosmotoga sp.]|nr:sodium transport system permease protein [Kosmotoga sp.]
MILSQMLRFEEFDVNNYNVVGDSDNTIIVEFDHSGNKLTAKIYYNSTSSKSRFASQMVKTALNSYEKLLVAKRLSKYSLNLKDLDAIDITDVDMAPKEAQGTDFLAVMLPYLILIYIFSGSMNIGLATTAGEKERGTLSPILVNQVSRTSIALGKVLYVMSTGLINSVSTVIGFMIAFKILGDSLGGALPMNIAAFTPGKTLGLLFTILTVSALASSIIVLLGSFAKSMKEAGTYIMPIYIGVLVLGISTMQMDPSKQLSMYLIPMLNSVFVMKDIIIARFELTKFLVMLLSNIAVTSVVIYAIAKLFNSERILESSE